jgi:2-phosphosulfolactate phosphatase
MEINILQLIEGAQKARGLAVIIDVFRAFTLACYAIQNGADQIIPVGSLEDALKIKQLHPEYILLGERQERKPEGFDFGNSPTHIEHIDFSGKILVHTTSAGTQGIVNAGMASEIITGSFVNAGAIIRYIQLQKPEVVSLVCMGYSALKPADEDSFCAEYIRSQLLGNQTDFPEMVQKLRVGSGKRLLDPINLAHSPSRDFDLCTDLNKFPFILKVFNEEGRMVLKPVIV